jgi:glutaredoxin-related protein
MASFNSTLCFKGVKDLCRAGTVKFKAINISDSIVANLAEFLNLTEFESKTENIQVSAA